MAAASCQFGSMTDTTLPGGIRVISVRASMPARACSVSQSTRISPSTTTVCSGVRRAASGNESARVECTHSPRRYASAARCPSTLTDLNLASDPAHGHRMAIPRGRMRVDGDLGYLTIRCRVGALHFECWTACFDFEQVGQFLGGGNRRDFLVHRNDAHSEEILDQRKDRTGAPL